MPTRLALLAALLAPLLLTRPAVAANPSMMADFNFATPRFIHPHPFAAERVVVQVSQGDPARWTLVLNNVANMLEFMGQDRLQIVVVAYGPGLKMLLKDSPVAKRIASLDAAGVEFDACHNTMEGMAKALGHMPVLVDQAVIVPAGVMRILQLQKHGFHYLKP
ncbi:MAG: DsrE family protein [Rhodospirillales bacterium]|nr:DsrE family protein [Rhodospirillales bacterium]